MFIATSKLVQAEMHAKPTSTGLIRGLVSVWYSRQRLAACSATTDIHLQYVMMIVLIIVSNMIYVLLNVGKECST